MFEKKFLLYLIYITLIEVREYSYETGNDRFFWLSDLLHNIPLEIDSDEEHIKELYYSVIDKVKDLKIERWLEFRTAEFYSRFPEFK